MAKTNCEQGDLAMYVGKQSSARGMIVKCVRTMNWFDLLDKKYMGMMQPAWLIDPPLNRDDGFVAKFASDHALRPIRDSKEEDEMLMIAGKPKEPFKANHE